MIQILKQIPFFNNLGEEDLKMIAEKVQMDYFPADHIIFKEGDQGDKMYVIKSGQVQVIRDNSILTLLGDNAFFGEMALVSDEKRNATIKAVTDLEVLIIDKNDFRHLLETNRNMASVISYEVIKRANSI
jgi:CRP-like cAMP-binding protein